MPESLQTSDVIEDSPLVSLEESFRPFCETEDRESFARIRHIFRNAHFYAPRAGQGTCLPSRDEVFGARPDCQIDLASVSGCLSSLPSLPTVVADLLRAIDDEGNSTDTLAKKLAVDQAMVARLLRVANSSFYGLQRKVISVSDAIVVLGLGNVRNLILTVSVSNSLGASSTKAGAQSSAFWTHSIATAICAEALAGRMRCNPESAFAAGLLHDIGQLVLATHYPQQREEVRRYRQRLDCHIFEAEQKVLGIDHAQIGEFLGKRWNFPLQLCTAIAGHHDPEVMNSDPLACVVHLADAMVHALDFADHEIEMMPRIYAPCWQQAALSWADCQAIFDEVELGVTKFSEMVGRV